MRCHGPALVLLALVITALSTCSQRAAAHGVDPIGVAVVERGGGDVSVRVDRPLSLAGAALAVSIDAACSVGGDHERTLTGTRAVDEHQFRCGRALAGRTLRIDGLEALGLDVVFRAELADGSVHRSVIGAGAPEVTLPTAASRGATLLAYLMLGGKHLLLGFDHLLFILGTLLIERRPPRVALALTGFTVGHSLTLCAAVFGLVRVPAAWAEVAIALSLVWIAVAVARSEHDSRSNGRIAVALVIGLVHGLGFADLLLGAGIPERDLPLALLGFNLGIELAQLAFAAAALLVATVAMRAPALRLSSARSWLAHGIGALAVMWCVERVLAA